MKFYALYFAVGLLAFGISSFIVFNFISRNHTIFSKVEYINASKVEDFDTSIFSKNPEKIEFIKIELKTLPCKDKILKLVWDNLKEETASINADEATKIKDCSDIIEVGENFDLNKDRRKKVIIVSHSSPFHAGGDGYTLWIFQKIDENNYRKIFEGIASFFDFKNTKTKGYEDILTNRRYNSAEYSYVIYKFNGEKYVPKQCWNESKLVKNKDGELVEGKKWKSILRKCNELEKLP